MSQVTTKRFTVNEYHRLVELGFLTEDDGIELIRGELVQMAAKGAPHSVCNSKLVQQLDRLILDRAVVRGQEPITLPNNSEPEPDVVIARGQPDDYLSNHPHPEDVLLVIEVSDSTLNYDQTVKLPLYAEAQIWHYWIFNLITDQLERYSQPYQDLQGNFGYRTKQISLQTETVALPEFSDISLDLKRAFPAP
ncbi:Uma2 family endonuclease [Myxacorys almedinensis]|uniref:Uma2 family endonuclease n=1 Tax=Myxacorys almedinensis A TaxID=2690445 RepID=A0A8J7Z708_9CYAN|nr:Uma2 family endonuclease [Myxacorys almedinensis]NDJ19321.1 Uma2 family endonuclease [Myxacorys almedinensis A]